MRRLLPILSLVLMLLAVAIATLDITWPLEQADELIFWQLRLPLILTAIMVGASLALSAAVLQVLLHNPLADPGIIGISSGASLCAALFVLFGGGLLSLTPYFLPLVCFIGALLSAAIIYSFARRFGQQGHTVILAGLGISTLCAAIIAWLYLFADAQAMRNLTFWLMGNLHQADWTVLSVAVPLSAGAIVILLLQGKNLNRYYFGDDTARLAGIDLVAFKRLNLLLSALLVAIAVACAGSIAFVGLLVPHMLRNFFGLDNRLILPASALGGAVLMLFVVLVSQSVSGVLLPVSMLTATLGAPVFIYSLIRGRRRA